MPEPQYNYLFTDSALSIVKAKAALCALVCSSLLEAVPNCSLTLINVDNAAALLALS